jgi:hypothetical protein
MTCDKRRFSGRVRLAEHASLIVLRRSACQDEPTRWPVRVFPFMILAGVKVRRSLHGDLFVRGTRSPARCVW